ncbi:hypothetical protein PMI11_05589 [Rhizobium sp. CF142]|nr:hypothetical protein PMI11_05589 [Rhizobium sp. CF142]
MHVRELYFSNDLTFLVHLCDNFLKYEGGDDGEDDTIELLIGFRPFARTSNRSFIIEVQDMSVNIEMDATNRLSQLPKIEGELATGSDAGPVRHGSRRRSCPES